MRRCAALLVILVAALLPSAAFAQQAQDPSAYPIRGQAQVLAFGAQRPGDTFSKNDCGFLAGQQATITINGGAPVGTDAVESDGCVKFDVKVVDQDTINFKGTTSADGDHDALRCRANTITITGPVAGGAAESRQVENRFTIACGAVAASNLPRTGSDIAPLVALGGVLIVFGATVVLIVRRRRTLADTATA
jgi:LPXTG-motif cell wall-anchored protein